MTIGEKIKLIRNFRGLTQKELGIQIGFNEKGADNRIAQYETNYRVPKKDTLIQIAKVLNINSLNFVSEVSGSIENIMQTFFWLDEDNPNCINLFQLVRNKGKTNYAEDTSVRYNDTDDWPAHAPVGIWFNYGLVNEFMREWLIRKNELKSGKITKDEYFEWKLNWPKTCDDCGKFEPRIKWKRIEEDK